MNLEGAKFVENTSLGKSTVRVSVDSYGDTVKSPSVRSNLEGGGKISVGTTPVEVTFSGTTTMILITADIDNTGVLYVGKSNVTSSGSNSITYLQPGDALEISYDDSSNALYVVGSTSGQYFWKGALL